MKYILFIISILIRKKRHNIRKQIGGYFMKFIKGMLIGTIVSTGLVIAFSETMGQDKKKIMKKGKQMIKKMGII